MDVLLYSTISLVDERSNVNSKNLLMKIINNKCNYRAFVMIQDLQNFSTSALSIYDFKTEEDNWIFTEIFKRDEFCTIIKKVRISPGGEKNPGNGEKRRGTNL